ncbi:MAG: hypothetical protein AVDCRST_MAG77-400, partial [uncultured Chloroflexi bacterium]
EHCWADTRQGCPAALRATRAPRCPRRRAPLAAHRRGRPRRLVRPIQPRV